MYFDFSEQNHKKVLNWIGFTAEETVLVRQRVYKYIKSCCIVPIVHSLRSPYAISSQSCVSFVFFPNNEKVENYILTI